MLWQVTRLLLVHFPNPTWNILSIYTKSALPKLLFPALATDDKKSWCWFWAWPCCQEMPGLTNQVPYFRLRTVHVTYELPAMRRAFRVQTVEGRRNLSALKNWPDAWNFACSVRSSFHRTRTRSKVGFTTDCHACVWGKTLGPSSSPFLSLSRSPGRHFRRRAGPSVGRRHVAKFIWRICW